MKSINKALDILEAVSVSAESELRLTEICEATGLLKSTANRIISILVKRGYMKQTKKRGKYYLNRKFISLNIQNQNIRILREIAAPYLLRLSNLVGESTIIAVKSGNNVRVIEAVEKRQILSINVDLEVENPMYATGSGKILLAYMSDEELEQYLNTTEFRKLTANTITDANHLKAFLKMIKKEGVAYDDEESFLGIKNVSVFIRNSGGKVFASLGVLGPSVRFTREVITQILPDIKQCAKEISEAIEHSSLTM